MQDSFCFIVNTASNRGRAGTLFSDNLDAVKSRFPEAHFYMIEEEDRIDECAAQAAHQFEYVIAAGGDGTARQVAKGLLGTESVLGVLPLGSGNDFAKSLGMDLPFTQALEQLQHHHVERIDIIETEGDLVLNTFGIGIDGLTNYYAQKSTIPNGTLRYFGSAVRSLFRSAVFHYECVIDGDRIAGKSWMIVVANGATEGARYEISPDSINSDGAIEVVIVRDVPLMRLLPEFLKLSAGIPFDEQIVTKRTCQDSLLITLDRKCYAHSDGEIVPSADCFRFNIKKQILPVIMRTCI